MKIIRKELAENILRISKSLGGNILGGIVFDGEYMTAMNRDGYERVKLPSPISDSFVLPTQLIMPVLQVKGKTLEITRSEKYLTVKGRDEEMIVCFTDDADMDKAIEEYDN